MYAVSAGSRNHFLLFASALSSYAGLMSTRTRCMRPRRRPNGSYAITNYRKHNDRFNTTRNRKIRLRFPARALHFQGIVGNFEWYSSVCQRSSGNCCDSFRADNSTITGLKSPRCLCAQRSAGKRLNVVKPYEARERKSVG
eukprot:TRINITY_DN70498_c0_g1_i1.p1 TRINITY_DN70498_c0_g1~~TRINITY_DN70498_c0_g1_i1.p1  ORF type:complete len:141 (+),score=1.52 TRINITY_DN70498_c0_g1_i1:26-448(+)